MREKVKDEIQKMISVRLMTHCNNTHRDLNTSERCHICGKMDFSTNMTSYGPAPARDILAGFGDKEGADDVYRYGERVCMHESCIEEKQKKWEGSFPLGEASKCMDRLGPLRISPCSFRRGLEPAPEQSGSCSICEKRDFLENMVEMDSDDFDKVLIQTQGLRELPESLGRDPYYEAIGKFTGHVHADCAGIRKSSLGAGWEFVDDSAKEVKRK